MFGIVNVKTLILLDSYTTAQRKHSSITYVVAMSQLHRHHRRISVAGSSMS